MPFSIASVAFVLDDIECQRVFVSTGVSNGAISSLDHDVLTLVTVMVSVGMLVEAMVSDVLSDFHAVQTHISKGNSVGVVRNLIIILQIVDQESPFVNEVHLSCEERFLWSDTSFRFLLEDTVDLEFIRV